MSSTETIWRDFSAELRVYIARRVENPDDADDVLQDVFVKIHARIDQLDDESRVAPWVYRIARNTVVDFYRRRAARPTVAADGVDAVVDADPAGAEPPSLANWMRGAVQSLPEKYREAITLTEIEGLSQKELAERLGISHSGAKSRVQRGRETIKEMLLACCHLEFDRRGKIIDFKRRGDCRHCQPACDDEC